MSVFFKFMAATASSASAQPSRTPRTGERSKKVRLILLAIEMMALKRGWRGQSIPARISVPDLANSYLHDHLAATEQAARKMAHRDLEEIHRVFGLTGDDAGGYSLAMEFHPPRVFYKMFRYWRNHLAKKSTPHDDSLKMMLDGLIQAIDSAFTDDPICISELARELRERYGKRNLREPRKTLQELFFDRALAFYLPWEPLNSEEEDTIKVDLAAEPLLLRRRAREEVGGNVDGTWVMARPGLIRQQALMHMRRKPPNEAQKLERFADAVNRMELWQTEEGRRLVPYQLHLERERNNQTVLVVCWLDEGTYEDIPTDFVKSWPTREETPVYLPNGLTKELWARWKSLSSWQV